jgi:hypothetical protein
MLQRKLMMVTMMAALAGGMRPGEAAAQARGAERLAVTPYAGAFLDGNFGGDPTAGVLGGARLAFALSDRLRLVGDVGYSEVDGVGRVGPADGSLLYGNDWFLTTAGAEWDAAPGGTALSLGVQLGAGWRRNEDEGNDIGVPDPALRGQLRAGGWSSVDAVVPGIALRQQLGSRAALRLALQDYILDVLEGPAFHSPALTLGVTVR